MKAGGKAFIGGAGFEPGTQLALEFPFKKGVKTTHVLTDAAGEFRTFVNIQR